MVKQADRAVYRDRQSIQVEKRSVRVSTDREPCHVVLPESGVSDQSTGVEGQSNTKPTVSIAKRPARTSTGRERRALLGQLVVASSDSHVKLSHSEGKACLYTPGTWAQ